MICSFYQVITHKLDVIRMAVACLDQQRQGCLVEGQPRDAPKRLNKCGLGFCARKNLQALANRAAHIGANLVLDDLAVGERLLGEQ